MCISIFIYLYNTYYITHSRVYEILYSFKFSLVLRLSFPSPSNSLDRILLLLFVILYSRDVAVVEKNHRTTV